MYFPEYNQPLNLRETLVDLAGYRLDERLACGEDPLLIHVAYAQENLVYEQGTIMEVSDSEYARYRREKPNDLVNKFGHAYVKDMPLLLHKKLADVQVDVAIDMYLRYGQVTLVMDGLRTYESGVKMQENRPDLVASGLLAKAGSSAHNRALAVDSKLFVRLADGTVVEADEHGHLDDENMATNSRFYAGPMADAARANRLNRLQAWQRASVKNQLPIANLLAEFWDDRVPGSPADVWRVLSCRALCIGLDGNPKTNPIIARLKDALNALAHPSRQLFAEEAHALFSASWHALFTPAQKQALEASLGNGASSPPALSDFLFHEWLETIHDHDLLEAGLPAQSA